MATPLEAREKFARKTSALIQHLDLDADSLGDISTLFSTLAAIESTGTERHREIDEAITAWLVA